MGSSGADNVEPCNLPRTLDLKRQYLMAVVCQRLLVCGAT